MQARYSLLQSAQCRAPSYCTFMQPWHTFVTFSFLMQGSWCETTSAKAWMSWKMPPSAWRLLLGRSGGTEGCSVSATTAASGVLSLKALAAICNCYCIKQLSCTDAKHCKRAKSKKWFRSHCSILLTLLLPLCSSPDQDWLKASKQKNLPGV